MKEEISLEEAQNAQEGEGNFFAPYVPSCGHDSYPGPAPFNGDIMSLCDVVRETAFALHTWFRHGQFEKVYENALAHRLRKLGIAVDQQFPLPVFDEDGKQVGDYQADLLIDRRLVVELKACKTLADEHIAQVLGYLRASRLEHGLLINFGAPRLQVKKLIFSHEKAQAAQNKNSFVPSVPLRGEDKTHE